MCLPVFYLELGNKCWNWKRQCGAPLQMSGMSMSFEKNGKHFHSGQVMVLDLWIHIDTTIVYQAASGERKPASALALAEISDGFDASSYPHH